MSTGIVIAPATATDLAPILALLERHHLPVDGLSGHLATALVARDEDALIGVAALELYPDGALLRSVAVDAALRARGIGSELTAAALKMAERLGARDVFLLTTTAERYFPRFGFEPITRDAVPLSVRSSVEFTSACPASAVVMRRRR